MKNEKYFDVKQDVLQQNDVVFEKIDIDESYTYHICCKSKPTDISVEEVFISEINKYFDIVVFSKCKNQ